MDVTEHVSYLLKRTKPLQKRRTRYATNIGERKIGLDAVCSELLMRGLQDTNSPSGSMQA